MDSDNDFVEAFLEELKDTTTEKLLELWKTLFDLEERCNRSGRVNCNRRALINKLHTLLKERGVSEYDFVTP